MSTPSPRQEHEPRPCPGPPLPPPPPSKVLLDHRFFPHVVDLIFSHLTYPGLVACSRASRAWREKAKPRLLEHIAIFECEDNVIVVNSRDLEWPNLSTRLIVAERSNLGALRCVIDIPKTVDIYKEVKDPAMVAAFPTAWPKGFTRLLGVNPPAWPHHYPLDQYHVQHLHSDDAITFIDYHDGRYMSQAGSGVHSSRMAFSVNCYSDPTLPLQPTIPGQLPAFSELVPCAGAASSVVIILNNCVGQSPPNEEQSASKGSHSTYWTAWVAGRNRKRIPRLGAACELLELGVYSSYVDVVQVIGLEAFMPEAQHFGYIRRMCDAVEEETDCTGRLPFYEAGMCLGDMSHSSTHEQYARKVGPRLYRLETMR